MLPYIEKSEITKIYTLFFTLQASSKTKKILKIIKSTTSAKALLPR